jgi:hypothetical protein
VVAVKIHALASMPHYADHVEAIFKHLQPELQGERRYGARVTAKGLDPGDVVMIAGFYDFDRAPDHKIIYVEHGAGQSYRGDPRSLQHPAYHGSPHHPERVIGYVAPRQEVADSWSLPAFAAGAPICDPYPLVTRNYSTKVAITFHWNARRICPEAGSALGHFAEHLGTIVAQLRRRGFSVFGHHHPRDHILPLMWRRLGVTVIDANIVRQEVDLLICDNSSLMYEMSYLSRQVWALNSPEYRRDVEHGLRFWNWSGPEFDDAPQLLEWIDAARPYIPCVPEAPNATQAYDRPLSDGQDGRRAASWVTMLLHEM